MITVKNEFGKTFDKQFIYLLMSQNHTLPVAEIHISLPLVVFSAHVCGILQWQKRYNYTHCFRRFVIFYKYDKSYTEVIQLCINFNKIKQTIRVKALRFVICFFKLKFE